MKKTNKKASNSKNFYLPIQEITLIINAQFIF